MRAADTVEVRRWIFGYDAQAEVLEGLSKMKQAMWKADPVGGQVFSDLNRPPADGAPGPGNLAPVAAHPRHLCDSIAVAPIWLQPNGD